MLQKYPKIPPQPVRNLLKNTESDEKKSNADLLPFLEVTAYPKGMAIYSYRERYSKTKSI